MKGIHKSLLRDSVTRAKSMVCQEGIMDSENLVAVGGPNSEEGWGVIKPRGEGEEQPRYWSSQGLTYVPAYICTYVCTYVLMYIRRYVGTCVHTHVCTYVRMYVFMYLHNVRTRVKSKGRV